MKKVLLTVSLLANVVLAGALIYTTMEINKLDDQREIYRSLTINWKGSLMDRQAPARALQKPEKRAQAFLPLAQ